MKEYFFLAEVIAGQSLAPCVITLRAQFSIACPEKRPLKAYILLHSLMNRLETSSIFSLGRNDDNNISNF